MKRIIWGLFTAIALCGCSSDDNSASKKGGATSDGTSRYLSVGIVSSSSTIASKAAGNNDEKESYKDGTDASENKIENVRFYFFYADGKAAPVKKEDENNYVNYFDGKVEEDESEMPNIEKKLKATVVINVPAGDKLPASMIAIVNGDKDELGTASKSISELQDFVVNDYSKLYDGNNFLMTSSVYAADDKGGTTGTLEEKFAVKLETENFQQTPELAEANPVEIYVERVLAKVAFKQDYSSFSNKITTVDGNNTYIEAKDKYGEAIKTSDGKQLYIKLCNWGVTANIDKSYLFKKIQTGWSVENNWGTGLEWTYPAFHRSYWAQNPSDAKVELATKDAAGGYTNYSGITNANFTNGVVYCQENAANDDKGTKDNTTTKVIIAAELYTQDDQNNFTKASIYEYAGQRYLTAEDCAKAMLTAVGNNIYVEDSIDDQGNTQYRGITSANVDFVSAISAGKVTEYSEYTTGNKETGSKTYKSYLKLKDGTYYTTSDGTTFTKIEDLSTSTEVANLQTIYAKVYAEGKSYFYFDIQHLGSYTGVPSTVEFGQYGVVRNHVYNVSITGITGIGTPVFNPKEYIVPEKPDDETYVAARINILSWRIVTNSVSLDW